MKPNGKNMKLAAFDDIFKNEETRQEEQMERVQMIAVAEMDDSPGSSRTAKSAPQYNRF